MIPNAMSVIPLMTVEELGELLQKSPRTVREMCYKKLIPHVKVGRSIRFELHKIQEWLRDECQIEAGTARVE